MSDKSGTAPAAESPSSLEIRSGTTPSSTSYSSSLAAGNPRASRPFDSERIDTDETLSDIDITIGDFVELYIHAKGAIFPMLIRRSANAKNILVFGQSAFANRNIELPVYHRWSWIKDFPDCTCIVLGDPTMDLGPDILGGWFQGTPEHFFAETAAGLVRDVAARLGVGPDNIVFYGTSAGGFGSILMASEIGGHAVAEIPQTVMSNYHIGGAIENLLKYCYGGISWAEAKQAYAERMDLTVRIKANKRLPNVLYLHNLADKIHGDRHLMPYFEMVSEIWEENPDLRQKQFLVETYFARSPDGDGHVVAPTDTALRAVRRALDEFPAQ